MPEEPMVEIDADKMSGSREGARTPGVFGISGGLCVIEERTWYTMLNNTEQELL